MKKSDRTTHPIACEWVDPSTPHLRSPHGYGYVRLCAIAKERGKMVAHPLLFRNYISERNIEGGQSKTIGGLKGRSHYKGAIACEWVDSSTPQLRSPNSYGYVRLCAIAKEKGKFVLRRRYQRSSSRSDSSNRDFN